MSSILVVDDEADIQELICFNLQKNGHTCACAATGEEGFKLIRKLRPDLIVLDIMLPDISGVEILKAVKSDPELRLTPVVMLTARGEEVDRVVGFELGAEDYITKPFSVRELLLRIRNILARFTSETPAPPVFRFSGIEIDLNRYEVTIEGQPIQLTTTEFNLLVHLIRNPDRVLTRDSLLEHLWGYDFDGTTRTIDTHIQRLRHKLGRYGACVQTVRGLGYRLGRRSVEAIDLPVD